MKIANRKCGRRDLNVYSVGYVFLFFHPIASSPFSGIRFTSESCITLLGYAIYISIGIQRSQTLTNEVGYLLGLYHTFQGSCSKSSDEYVNNTPAEGLGSPGYPAARDTFPAAGVDPIRMCMPNLIPYTCRRGG
ncbi:hypothetical protein DFH09DRAFT_911890 [Mycena vulgaris]|nr:hypothetical protein DFH09DRAFT_911890 [Mycena vulgaris]